MLNKEFFDSFEVWNDRWSYNPFSRTVNCYVWKNLGEYGIDWKQQAWFTDISFSDFLTLLKKYREGFRPTWQDKWVFEEDKD